ncbi:hypothetical protein ASPZODRAFT_19312 [Penicilliopsis zonata CBS 506.65]|uniref:Glycosyltransferase family 31 protein n=1 Tax=Penicilliopsis zonata CBS 506.65 TaxID=1073090 RepID=A0A1L9S8V4_9EURO|nr:hypothetical protein ASPZODRAFT_19312 [Penicilliopsis zonata CBS 506.65]OJJ43590.1 hypothetical protein ASPZODRAFT_19312 [Penicilliopsis zonata CBS 506.65]
MTTHRRKSAFFRALVAAALLVCAALVVVLYSRSAPLSDLANPLVLGSSTSSTSSSDDAADVDPDGENGGCNVNLDRLRAWNVNAKSELTSVQYSRIEITASASKDFKQFPDRLDTSLPAYRQISLANKRDHFEILPNEACDPHVHLHVPFNPSRADASHILFGVATTITRLNESLEAFAHWSRGTGARIIAVVEPDENKVLVRRRAEELGIHLQIFEDRAEYLDRYFSLVRVLFQQRTPDTKWVSFIDDDTFFPSMTNLVRRLDSYDASQPQYIGALSEDFAQMHVWGYMAYGGGGVFLSIPLLTTLNEVYPDCRKFTDTGDWRLARCIYTYTTTKFTWERGLYQLDLHGDASGFYESGRPLPLSLHHWKSWFDADMVQMSAVSAVCGDACLLRRWRLNDDWFLVNGFSLIQYSSLLDDLLGMEETWDRSMTRKGNEFAFSLGPLRPKDTGKLSLRLKEAVVAKKVVRQYYLHEGDEETEAQVVEVVWRLNDDDSSM